MTHSWRSILHTLHWPHIHMSMHLPSRRIDYSFRSARSSLVGVHASTAVSSVYSTKNVKNDSWRSILHTLLAQTDHRFPCRLLLVPVPRAGWQKNWSQHGRYSTSTVSSFYSKNVINVLQGWFFFIPGLHSVVIFEGAVSHPSFKTLPW